MGLVDDDRVVLAQHPVAVDLVEQDAVGHQLDLRARADVVGEAHLVADQAADLLAQLLRDAFGDGAGGEAARLGVADRRPRPSSRQIFGSWVVLPDPVSPARITTWLSRMARAISSRRWLTGSSGG